MTTQQSHDPNWHPAEQRWSVWNGRERVWAPAVPQNTQPAYTGPKMSYTRVQEPMHHGVHLLLTVLTCGLWGIFVWLPACFLRSIIPGRKVKTYYR